MKKIIYVIIFAMVLNNVCHTENKEAKENIFNKIEQHCIRFKLTAPEKMDGGVNYYPWTKENSKGAQVLFRVTNLTDEIINYRGANYFLVENNGKNHLLKFEWISGNDENEYLSEHKKSSTMVISCYSPQAEKIVPMDEVDGFYIKLKNGNKITFFEKSSFKELTQDMVTNLAKMSEFQKKNKKVAEHLENINAIVRKLWEEHENSIKLMQEVASVDKTADDIALFITNVMGNGDSAMELGNLILQLFTLQAYAEYTPDTRGILIYNLKYAKQSSRMYLMQADGFTSITNSDFYKEYSRKYSKLIRDLERNCDEILLILVQEPFTDFSVQK